MLRRLVSHSGAVVLLFTLAIVVSYLPALIVPYGLTDDYLYLAQAEELGHAVALHQERVARGRCRGPALLGCARAVLSAAGTIDNLRFVRVISVVGILALALPFYWALLRSRVARTPAALIALLVCTLPVFQLFASWIAFPALGRSASRLLVPAGRGRNGCAASALRQACLGDATAARRRPDVPAGGHVLLGLPRRRVGRRRRRSARAAAGAEYFAVAAVAAGIAFLGYKLGIRLIGEDAIGALAVPSRTTSPARPSGSGTGLSTGR